MIDQNTRGTGEGASERPHQEDRIGDVRKYGEWNSAAESYLARRASRAKYRINAPRAEHERRHNRYSTTRSCRCSIDYGGKIQFL